MGEERPGQEAGEPEPSERRLPLPSSRCQNDAALADAPDHPSRPLPKGAGDMAVPAQSAHAITAIRANLMNHDLLLPLPGQSWDASEGSWDSHRAKVLGVPWFKDNFRIEDSCRLVRDVNTDIAVIALLPALDGSVPHWARWPRKSCLTESASGGRCPVLPCPFSTSRVDPECPQRPEGPPRCDHPDWASPPGWS